MRMEVPAPLYIVLDLHEKNAVKAYGPMESHEARELRDEIYATYGWGTESVIDPEKDAPKEVALILPLATRPTAVRQFLVETDSALSKKKAFAFNNETQLERLLETAGWGLFSVDIWEVVHRTKYVRRYHWEESDDER